MKREILMFALLFLMSFASAAECVLDISLLNQDPYPATPGESVKVVFQIDGISNRECGTVQFNLKENYPFTVDPESTNPILINSGTYSSSKYSSYQLATYKVRIDKEAMEGDTPIEVGYTILPSQAERIKEFNIYVENTAADFEIYVKDYNINTRTLTFEVLNIEDVDIEALTIEIPKQENVEIKGANKVNIGDLDSNEYTTADFEAIVNDGEIDMTIYYTDSVNNRRQINKTIIFDSSYFTDLSRDKVSQPWWLYIIIVVAVGWFVWRKYKKHKLKKKLHHA